MLLALLATAACSGSGEPVAIAPSGARVPSEASGPSDDQGGTSAPASAAATESQEDGGPLLGLPPCQAPPEAMADVDVDVEGLDWPDGAIVTNVQPGDPLVTVTGYIATTPVRVRQYYQGRDDLEIMEIEDEIFEAEALFDNGTHRNYIKAQAVCREGTRLLGVVAPDVDAKGLPAPQGSPQPSG